jgi:hypothetical protein
MITMIEIVIIRLIIIIIITLVLIAVIELAIMVFRLAPRCNTRRVIIIIATGNTEIKVITNRIAENILLESNVLNSCAVIYITVLCYVCIPVLYHVYNLV